MIDVDKLKVITTASVIGSAIRSSRLSRPR
jgi:hypothetical protein